MQSDCANHLQQVAHMSDVYVCVSQTNTITTAIADHNTAIRLC